MNAINLSNKEEIIAEKYEEINNKVIKSEINVKILRNMLERYQILFNTFYDTQIVKNLKLKEIVEDEDSIWRFRAGLSSNIRGVWEIQYSNEIHTEVMDKIEKNVLEFTDTFNFQEIE